MLKINSTRDQSNAVDYLSCVAKSVYETAVLPKLKEEVEVTFVEIVPTTSSRVRDLFFNVKKRCPLTLKTAFSDYSIVKEKLLHGMPHVKNSATGKLTAFALESDAFERKYDLAQLIPPKINAFMKNTSSSYGVLTFNGVKVDAKNLSMEERAYFATAVRLYMIEYLLDYYAAYISEYAHMAIVNFMVERLCKQVDELMLQKSLPTA